MESPAPTLFGYMYDHVPVKKGESRDKPCSQAPSPTSTIRYCRPRPSLNKDATSRAKSERLSSREPIMRTVSPG